MSAIAITFRVISWSTLVVAVLEIPEDDEEDDRRENIIDLYHHRTNNGRSSSNSKPVSCHLGRLIPRWTNYRHWFYCRRSSALGNWTDEKWILFFLSVSQWKGVVARIICSISLERNLLYSTLIIET